MYYFNLDDGAESDKAAIKWLQSAATQEQIDALFLLGFCYSLGKGVKQSTKTAIQWYEKAAAKGQGNAIYWLSLCYLKGEGKKKDISTAAKLITPLLMKDDETRNYFLKMFEDDEASNIPAEDVKLFLDTILSEQKKLTEQEKRRENKKEKDKGGTAVQEKGMCPFCGGKFSMMGTCKGCKADRTFGKLTISEWKDIINTEARLVEDAFKKSTAPYQRLSAIRSAEQRISKRTDHPLEMVQKLYEMYAPKAASHNRVFK